MEYLMTYGWAILIIAVVLAALFQLGVFNSTNFAPKAPPGACQVFRPNGPGSTQFINTEGVCNGELPEYVAQFNGQNGEQIATPISTQGFPVTGQTTWSAWVDPNTVPYNEIISDSSYQFQLAGYYGPIFPAGNGAGVELFSGNWIQDPTVLSPGMWYLITATATGTGVVGGTIVETLYVNGAEVDTLSAVAQYPVTQGVIYIGGFPNPPLNGLMSNVQIYNTSLSANEVSALYLEGIGGAPIDLQNLVGWWPLNGNAQDYSGNNNDGTATNVAYTGAWTSGYSAP